MNRKSIKKKAGRKKVYQLIKDKVRKEFVSQGGQDGRFATKVVPDKKKKYNRQKAKKIKSDE